MNAQPTSEKAKGLAREFLKVETCIHCVYQGYKLATLMWAVTQAKACTSDDERETTAWLREKHTSAIAALIHADRESLARLALEVVPETEASLAILRDKADFDDLREFMGMMLEKLR